MSIWIPRKKVADVMTTDVVSVTPSASFKEIVSVIEERRVSGVPVVDVSGEVVGVVSEADLLLKEEKPDLDRHHWLEGRQRRVDRAKAAGATAVDVMTTPAITIGPDATISEAARLMHERGVKRLIVVDSANRLAGVVSRSDLLTVFLRPDEAIRTDIERGLVVETLWMEPGIVTATVSQGMVTLKGTVSRRTDVDLVGSMTERLDGVVGVRNQLRFEWDDQRWAGPAGIAAAGPVLR